MLDGLLQEEFWRRFEGTVRVVVPEGGKNTVLTDNYIRLTMDDEVKTYTKNNKILYARIYERDGRPRGGVPDL